ncbi:(3S,6E)-nerolidol synthase 1-like isoform X3 [Mangifera indica]|uniref:(3S,6E)-nerolidol synthase 1-like isoform X3 n=1 Tax=Mangifera indica TaxID=29780 RepID=UPI001CF95847|nr:(3S,6E)-nerolidol synthase 1-like isoform X3 [Mangifera indica]
MSHLSPSALPIAPKKVSKISNPVNLIQAPNDQTKGITSSSAVLSIPFKQFLTDPNELTDNIYSKQYAQKLKAFKHILSKVGEDPVEGLAMVDAVQRSGIDYHFRDEIQQILQRQFMIFSSYDDHNQDDLCEVALRFRLLRQHGYYVPADIFNNFKNKEGKLNQKVRGDVNGLMGLYEASHLSIHGEEVLDEAGDYCAKLLTEQVKNLDHFQAEIVENTLAHPFHRSPARLMANNLFLTEFPSENKWIHAFEDLAKIDFNLVQSLHQTEVAQISKWWKDLGLSKKLEFVRDQPLKWYIWSMSSLTDANLSWQRVELTKAISFVYIIDDIFDVHGTLDELSLFTEIINRWDVAAVDQLPEYMRTCFKALDNVTNEISRKIFEAHGYNPVNSLQKAWGSLCNAFLVEAKWFSSRDLPTAEEYLKNGIITSGVNVGLVHIFFLLGENLTTETLDLIDKNPVIISSTATILRLWDDLGSAKDENQDGRDGSYLYYYMKEHPDCDAEATEKHVISKISYAWKILNKECLSPNPFKSSGITKASLNLARMVPLMYSYDNNQRLPGLEEYVKSLLFETVPIKGIYN